MEGLGQPGSYRIQHNYFKFHACCLYNHPVLDAVQAIVRQESFVSQQVNRIRVEAPSLALIMADPEPENMLAAKFSIPYAVAASSRLDERTLRRSMPSQSPTLRYDHWRNVWRSRRTRR